MMSGSLADLALEPLDHLPGFHLVPAWHECLAKVEPLESDGLLWSIAVKLVAQ
jgi:hypothetical protein